MKKISIRYSNDFQNFLNELFYNGPTDEAERLIWKLKWKKMEITIK